MAHGFEHTRLAAHTRRVDGLFDDARDDFTHWSETDAGVRLLASDRDALIAATLAAAGRRLASDPDDPYLRAYLDAEVVTDRILRRKWAIDPGDAVLMLQLATDEACWYYEIRVALHLAERALDASPGDPDVLDALVALRHRLESDHLHASDFFHQKVAPWLNRLLADHTPGDLVDLTFIDDRCAWGAAARIAVAHALDTHPGAAALAVHLASPRGTRASASWWAATEAHMSESASAALVRELADALTHSSLTPRDPDVDGFDAPDHHLVTPANVGLARGVVWAERFARDELAAQRLGLIVERSGDAIRGYDGLVARCNKVARAGIASLADRSDAASRAELDRLHQTLSFTPLVRMINDALGVR